MRNIHDFTRMDDKRLDFSSPYFDPLLALTHDPPIEPPVDAAPLDNIAKCRGILSSDMPESLANVESKQSTEEAKAKALSFKERALMQEQRCRESCTMSLKAVISHVKPGPLLLLADWTGTTVRVVTKHARGVRGQAFGTLVAFDKFTNLLLRDVEETYSVRIKVEKASGRSGTKLDQRERSLPLVMIKGDSVVAVSKANTAHDQLS